ncbi:DUF4440 domain-containing protein [Halobacillus massiliensis]|uniref:nuclear transport factor 2 family protein n=1 Tax=Halobacillus massiliensis TaxID=1926286 RepID=UPI0009E25B23|nr:DUF4440 domain-containing protein [Halobacillus massiliensis]
MKEEVIKKIKALEESHLKIENRNSSERLGEILSDDFLEFGSSGGIITKEDCLKEGVTLHELEMFNFELHPLGPEAVLTTYLVKNYTLNRNTLRSSVWKLQNNKWQLFFHQGTVTEIEHEVKSIYTK